MDGLLLTLRVALSLACVLGLMWFLARRAGHRGSKRPGQLEVVARQGVGGKSQVVLLRAAGRQYLLGVTEQQVSVLDTTDVPVPVFEDALADATAEQQPGSTALPSAAVADASRSPLAGSLLDMNTWRAAARSLTGRDRAA